jgi:hypothetical protein
MHDQLEANPSILLFQTSVGASQASALDAVPFVLSPKVAAAAAANSGAPAGPLVGLDRLLNDVELRLDTAQKLVQTADSLDFRSENTLTLAMLQICTFRHQLQLFQQDHWLFNPHHVAHAPTLNCRLERSVADSDITATMRRMRDL